MAISAELALLLCRDHPTEAARTLESLSIESAAELLGALPSTVAAGVLSTIDPGRGGEYLAHSGEDRAIEWLNVMPAGAAVRLLHRRARPDRERLIERMRPDAAGAVRRMLDHPVGAAGTLMDPDVISFPDSTLCGEALRRVLRFRQQVRYYVYVTDQAHRLTGVLTLRDLMQAPPNRQLAQVARQPVASLHVRDPRSVVLRHAGWQAHHALPVVDSSGLLVGMLRYETLRRLESEERLEDSPNMLVVGATLGQAWLTVTTALLDGLAASLLVSLTGTSGDTAESDHAR